MSEDIEFDNKYQFERVQYEVLPGESLHAVYDLKGGGSGYIGISNKRLIFQDRRVFGGKDNVLTSVPFSRISYVSTETDVKLIGRSDCKLLVGVGRQTFEFEFRGTQKALKAQRWIMEHLLG